LHQQQQQIETALADAGIYDATRKAELTKTLTDQQKVQKELSEVEEQWFEAQEAWEQQSAEFWQKNS
jgi:ATP-binding cassette subfamily F protein 3